MGKAKAPPRDALARNDAGVNPPGGLTVIVGVIIIAVFGTWAVAEFPGLDRVLNLMQ